MRARAVLLLLAPLALAGCSGSSEPEAPDPKPAYVEAASQVCTSADEEFSVLPVPSAPSQFGPYLQQAVAIAERAQRELAELPPPPADRAELESKVLDPFAQLVTDGKAFSERVSAAGTDDAALLALLSQRPTSAGIDREYLEDYGLRSCAEVIGKVG